MTECPNVAMRESLPDFLHGALSSVAYERVQSHLDTCDDCTLELELMRVVVVTSPTPVIDVQRIVQAIPAYQPPHRSRVHMGGYLRLAAGFLLAAVGIGTVVAVQRGDLWLQKTSSPIAVATIAQQTPAGMAIVGVSGLSDEHLEQLISEIDQLDAMPAAEPESVVPVALDGGA